MDEAPIAGSVRTLDFAPEAVQDIDWAAAEPQFTEEVDADVLDFPEAVQSGTPVVINREELIFLSASLGAGQLDVALTLPEAAAIFDALGSVLA